MKADRLSRKHQPRFGRRFIQAEIAAGALAAVLLLALYVAAPPSRSRPLDKMPPASAIPPATPAHAEPAPKTEFRLGGATFHEDVDLKKVPAEQDPSSRSVAAYGS